MSCHVLVFEQGASFAGLEVCRMTAASEGFTCEQRSLDVSVPAEQAKTSSCTVMAVAFGEPSEILSFLNRVQATVKDKTLIAILPGNCSADLLESVDQIVDDFVLWPVQN
jgi:hypothetical protein